MLEFINRQTNQTLFDHVPLNDHCRFADVCHLQALHTSTVITQRAISLEREVEASARLERDNEALLADKKNWEAKVKELEDLDAQLVSDNARLREDRNSLREEKKSLRAEAEAKKKEVSDLTLEKLQFEAKITDLEDQVTQAKVVGVAEFKDSEGYTDELSVQFYKGTDLVRDWVKKKHPDVDFSTLERDVTVYLERRLEGHAVCRYANF